MVVHSVMSRYARLARAVDGYGRPHVDLSSKQLLTARHMARDGNDLDTIAKAIGWKGKLPTLRSKLAKVNIKPKGKWTWTKQGR